MFGGDTLHPGIVKKIEEYNMIRKKLAAIPSNVPDTEDVKVKDEVMTKESPEKVSPKKSAAKASTKKSPAKESVKKSPLKAESVSSNSDDKVESETTDNNAEDTSDKLEEKMEIDTSLPTNDRDEPIDDEVKTESPGIEVAPSVKRKSKDNKKKTSTTEVHSFFGKLFLKYNTVVSRPNLIFKVKKIKNDFVCYVLFFTSI